MQLQLLHVSKTKLRLCGYETAILTTDEWIFDDIIIDIIIKQSRGEVKYEEDQRLFDEQLDSDEHDDSLAESSRSQEESRVSEFLPSSSSEPPSKIYE